MPLPQGLGTAGKASNKQLEKSDSFEIIVRNAAPNKQQQHASGAKHAQQRHVVQPNLRASQDLNQKSSQDLLGQRANSSHPKDQSSILTNY